MFKFLLAIIVYSFCFLCLAQDKGYDAGIEPYPGSPTGTVTKSAISRDTREDCGENFYQYLKLSEDFKPVNKDARVLLGNWNKWLFMPWRYQWPDVTFKLARDMKEAGINGGETQGVETSTAQAFVDNEMYFYVGHVAGKGDLHLLKEYTDKKNRINHDRPVCLLADSTIERLKGKILHNISKNKKFSTRVAYALDDEISWGVLTTPVKWDSSPQSVVDFNQWLLARYGSKSNLLREWELRNSRFLERMANLDDFQILYKRSFRSWNLSPWIDAISYMDSQLNNLVGNLVDYANELDPEMPCGFVGGQAPAAYGGYDYAKVIPKVQFLESYDIGCAMEIIRSFNKELMPVVQTIFVDPGEKRATWLHWYYLAHGSRGAIAWAKGWFGNDEDRQRRLSYGPDLAEIERASRKTYDAKWMHDGVAIYYSQSSIQLSFFMDCETHGGTWINRSNSMNGNLSTSVATHWAWTKLLEDHQLQYNFIPYRDVVLNGINPSEYPVLILPAVFSLSNAEVVAIKDYVKKGGFLIADHQVGIFDHHGRGRLKPALDDLFGITDHPSPGPGKLFNGKVLTEFNPESNYKATFINAAANIRSGCLRSKGFVVVERELPSFIENSYGEGTAVLLNVSIVEYLNKRESDFFDAKRFAKPITKYLYGAGINPWISVESGGEDIEFLETTYWEKQGRVYVYIFRNLLRSTAGGGKNKRFSKNNVELVVRFLNPKKGVIDERSGDSFGETSIFPLTWKDNEAALISFIR